MSITTRSPDDPVGGRMLMLRVAPMTDEVAVVHGVFTRERADGTVFAETEAACTTVRTEAGWRVAACVVRKCRRANDER